MHDDAAGPSAHSVTHDGREIDRAAHPVRCREHGRTDCASAAGAQADSSRRPLRRRAAMIARPARVRIRSRKPCVLARRRLFGWKVRLLTIRLQGRGENTRLLVTTLVWSATRHRVVHTVPASARAEPEGTHRRALRYGSQPDAVKPAGAPAAPAHACEFSRVAPSNNEFTFSSDDTPTPIVPRSVALLGSPVVSPNRAGGTGPAPRQVDGYPEIHRLWRSLWIFGHPSARERVDANLQPPHRHGEHL